MIRTAIHVGAAAALGGVAGLLGGLFGVGGGFLVIPLLGFFYGMDQQTAQGTALIMVVPNVLWAFSRYQQRFGVDLRMAASFAVPSLFCSLPLPGPSLIGRGAAVRGVREGRDEPGAG